VLQGRLAAVIAACVLVSCTAATADADPESSPQPVATDAPAPDAGPADGAAPAAVDLPPDGKIESLPPATTTSPDGWKLTVGAADETLIATAPLTTAISSRDYVAGGVFNGSMRGPEEDEVPHGTLEVGYQIGCGIDMSTSNGVTLAGTVGLNTSLGVLGADVISPLPEGILPGIGGSIGGGVTVGLKPGFVNIVPVSKKEFKGADPWVSISGFHVKIDGCVGQSFIRSYAVLTRSTDQSDAVLAYYGATKNV
jgi:MspA